MGDATAGSTDTGSNRAIETGDMSELTVGVLGGMGPESTAGLLLRITRRTRVAEEQDHLRVIVDSNPKIPNRTDALLSGKTGPIIEALTRTARNLERAGAEIIGMPCNTAHAFLGDVRSAVAVPVVDMIGETALRALEVFGRGAAVGLLATDGTLRSSLYHEALEAAGLRTISPSEQGVQSAVMDAIRSVKLHGFSEDACTALGSAACHLASKGAIALIAGCTEVSVVFERHAPDPPWLDPLDVLAEVLVRRAKGLDPSPHSS
jgi:aspartate racemase